MLAGRRWTIISGLAISAVAVLVACSGHPATNTTVVNPTPIQISLVEWHEPLLEVSCAELPTSIVSLPPVAPTPTATRLPSPPARRTPLVGWPVGGRISQGFGCSPFYTGLPGPGCPGETPWFHDGLDIAVPTGTPVRAAITGTVIFAGPDGTGPPCGRYRGYGLGVVVENGDEWQTLYAHLSRIEVAVGQVVAPETIIGATGETGCVSGAHLHFGLRHHDTLVDPRMYVQE